MAITSPNKILMLLLILLIHSSASQSAPCNQTNVTAGDTWVDIHWSLHCEVDTTEMVSYYHLSLTDNTAGIYNQDTNQYCMDRECSFLFTLARPCINYTISLELIDLDKNTFPYSNNQVTTEDEDPSAPRILSSTGTTTDTLDLTWHAPSTGEYCVDEYRVCYSSTERSMDSSCVKVVDTSTTLDSLLPCTQYLVTVTPVTGSGALGLSAFVTATTEDADPESPEGVSVDDRGYDYITLQWVKPEVNKQCIKGVGSFCVETSFLPPPSTTTVTGTEPSLAPPSPLTDTQQTVRKGTSQSTVSNLAACTVYSCWVVYPDTAGGWSAKSDTVSQWTWVKGVTISQPSSVTSLVGTDFMQVSWGAPSQASRCVDGYILAWRDDEGVDEAVTLPADTYSYTITSLRPCVEYQVEIKANSTNWGQEKFGAPATFSQSTGVAISGPVLDLQLYSVAEDSFTIGWSPPASYPQCVDHYDYKVSDGPLVDDCVQPKVQNGLQAHVGCLQCGASYTFRVWAVNFEGQSSPPAEMFHIPTKECS